MIAHQSASTPSEDSSFGKGDFPDLDSSQGEGVGAVSFSECPKLNAAERKVLAALASVASDDFGYISFRSIGRRSRCTRPVVRRACRSLARKGLAKFSSGLWTEDGTPAGSGYAITDAGLQHADKALVERIVVRFWE